MAQIEITDENEVITVQDSVQLIEGINKGIITSVELNKTVRGEDVFKYFRIKIKTKDVNGKDVEINTDFPFYISQGSELGKFLMKAGVNIVVGQNFTFKQLADLIGGKSIQFEAIKPDNFYDVVNDTIMFVQ